MLTTCLYFLANLGFAIWFLISLVNDMQRGRSLVIDIIFLITSTGFTIFNGYMIFNRMGGSIELRGGKIRCLRWNGSVWQQGYLHNVVDLEFVIPAKERHPSIYFVKYQKSVLVFHHEVENIELLVAEVEQRTGKRFHAVAKR